VILPEIERMKEFSSFIGQYVMDVDTDHHAFLRLIFQDGLLSVECPWRLRNHTEILIGESDCQSAPQKYSKDHLKRIVMNKQIVNISFHQDLFLLSIEFEGDLFFDLFHNSYYFEGWVLQSNNGLEIVALPGGQISN
jgi:hypothetical protein